MLIDRSQILKCFKVGQIIFRPVTTAGKLSDAPVTKNEHGEHPLKNFVRTVISDPNQNIYEPTVTVGGRGIITWLTTPGGEPFTDLSLPDNWYALRIKRECKSDVLNASVLTGDEAALEYYVRWRQEMSKVFDDYDNVCGLPFELSPSSARVWFKPEYDEKFELIGYNVKQIMANA